MKNISRHIRPFAAAIALGSASMASAALQVHQLGSDNTLVRITGDNERLLIIPVQESMPDAKIEVLVDGKVEDTFYVRLADSNIDYTVPFDLTPYKGHDVILNIVTSQSRSSVRDAQDDACWGNFSVADSFNTDNREKYRPAFHHAPKYGWMNDPNGMFYKDGVWHLYYQWNPYGSKWQTIRLGTCNINRPD